MTFPPRSILSQQQITSSNGMDCFLHFPWRNMEWSNFFVIIIQTDASVNWGAICRCALLRRCGGLQNNGNSNLVSTIVHKSGIKGQENSNITKVLHNGAKRPHIQPWTFWGAKCNLISTRTPSFILIAWIYNKISTQSITN